MHEEWNVPLAPLTTLGLGGPATRLVHVFSFEELADVVRGADTRGETLLVLGGGSNLVVGDSGVSLAVKIAFDAVEIVREKAHVLVTAGAGARWDTLVARAVEEGWSGIASLSGIPGLVGATPIQNVGAYGQEVSETIARVEVLDRRTHARAWLAREACGFSYRSSVFKANPRYVVTRVTFALPLDPRDAKVSYSELARALDIAEGERAPSREVRATVLALRRKKGMVIDPSDPESVSAGSFFMNPVLSPEGLRALEARSSDLVPRFVVDGQFKVPAAWLIERAGFHKGYGLAHVGISRKHALALVHRGGGTTAELLTLARALRDGVRARFGVELVPEPVMVGCAL